MEMAEKALDTNMMVPKSGDGNLFCWEPQFTNPNYNEAFFYPFWSLKLSER